MCDGEGDEDQARPDLAPKCRVLNRFFFHHYNYSMCGDGEGDEDQARPALMLSSFKQVFTYYNYNYSVCDGEGDEDRDLAPKTLPGPQDSGSSVSQAILLVSSSVSQAILLGSLESRIFHRARGGADQALKTLPGSRVLSSVSFVRYLSSGT